MYSENNINLSSTLGFSRKALIELFFGPKFNPRFLILKGVSNKASHQIGNKITKTSVLRVFRLCNVF